MRPVRLEMNGFASFRDRVVVDFTEADYFALVGPTGSGKSTVLDAITFALYGTAYRWGADNAVADALAPSSNRCTVSLTFDAGEHRYQVAREVRRSGQQVQQRKPSLVRFADPTAVVVDPDGPQPEVLAGEIKEIRQVIVEILGLDFADFCQCVVLPQGQFARFLSSTSKDRQKILLKLLGADHYEGIGRAANTQAAAADDRATFLTEQLQGLANATPEAEQEARQRAAQLETLHRQVDDLVPAIEAARTEATAARQREVELRADAADLSGVTVPKGIADLQAELDEARTSRDTAHEDGEAARTALDVATDAAKAGPQRVAITVAIEAYGERDVLAARLAPAQEAADGAVVAQEQTQTALTGASAELQAAQTRAVATGKELETARLAEEQTMQQVAQLDRVARPPGLEELTARAANLAADLVIASERHTNTTDQRSAAETALAAAPSGDALERALAELQALAEIDGDLDRLATVCASATTNRQEAEREDAAAQASLALAQQDRDDARQRIAAVHLRAGLEIGHACPVCDQTVAVAPPAIDDAEAGAADVALTAARRALETATAQLKAAERQEQDALASQRLLLDRREGAESRLQPLLPGRPGGAERDLTSDLAYVGEQRDARTALAAVLDQAQLADDDAKGQVASAESALKIAHAELRGHRDELLRLHGSLVALEPPRVDVDDLDPAWTTLVEWAQARRRDLDDRLQKLVDASTAAGVTAAAAADAETLANQTRATAQQDCDGAVRLAADTKAELSKVVDGLARLDAQLAQSPPRDDLASLLAEADARAADEKTCAEVERDLRAQLKEADEALRLVETRASEQRQALATARDRLHRLSPPVVDTADLAAGWAGLKAWADDAHTSRLTDADAAASSADTLDERHQALMTDLGTLLSEAGVDTDQNAAAELARASTVVAVAAERARNEAQVIATSVATASTTRDQIDEARERQQVASTLAGLMRSNKFPQWLADSALDSLVAGASDSLRRLSGDQFSLTHERGDFYVIDHADADLTRSVRTLSGGETFQASLALALALADHLAGMGGATKLESIFLDEGFGTLDPDALDTVADTLENLSQGERVVGVITHVAALAERAPVRFQVHRDSRTSHVEREDG